MFKAIPYLNSNRASEMLAFYEKHFNAVIKSKTMADDDMFGHSFESMNISEEEAKEFIMNAELEILGQAFMLSDTWGKEEVDNQGVYICFVFDGEDETEVKQAKDFYQNALDGGCEVLMPLGETEWTRIYALFKDPFGISWMISAN